MLTRCYHEAAESFENYHSKGITVCDRWRNGEGGLTGFECFAADVGEPPSPSHSIDRIENTEGYKPGNVRWATAKEQANNRSSNRKVTAFGRTMNLVQWVDETGLSEAVLRYRIIKKAMAPEIALTMPAANRGRRSA